MNISCFEIEDWQKPFFTKLDAHDVKFFAQPLNKENINESKYAEMIFTRATNLVFKFDENTLRHFPNLKCIATMSTGFDHIDLDYCKKNGITVSNVPNYGEDTVAEYTFALMLALSRKINYSIRNSNEYGVEGFDLKGKIIGIIGSGKIGLKVIALAKSFGMEVIAYDVYKNEAAAGRLGFRYVELNDLLRKADIISLHAPLTPETKYIINLDSIKHMKKGVVIINTARGGLIEPNAMLAGINSGTIAHAGLDVIDGDIENATLSKQPLIVQKLVNHPNVIATPHNAWNSTQAKARMMDTTVDNMLAFIAKSPKNVIV